MSTRRGEDGDGAWQCDHGAQYFTARDAAFRAEVARWQQAGVAAQWDARLASFDGSTWTTPHTPLERFVGTPRMTSPAAWLVQGLQQAGERGETQMHEQDEVVHLRDLLVEGIQHDFARIAAGAPMPALGEGAVCDYCAARGLCRKDFWND